MHFFYFEGGFEAFIGNLWDVTFATISLVCIVTSTKPQKYHDPNLKSWVRENPLFASLNAKRMQEIY